MYTKTGYPLTNFWSSRFACLDHVSDTRRQNGRCYAHSHAFNSHFVRGTQPTSNALAMLGVKIKTPGPLSFPSFTSEQLTAHGLAPESIASAQ